jgi:hypothetical protein
MASKTIQCGFESHPGHFVISQDIEDTVNPRLSSVGAASGTQNVSTPRLSASWLRVVCSVVKASSGDR